MTEVFKQTPLATAMKRVTFCAATSALLVTTSMAQAVEVKFGGYIKTDAIYDLDQDLGASLAASAVAVPSTTSNENFRIHALQSRFNITATEGDVKVFVEGDFFGGQGNEVVSNSAHFRLRHAYGQMGNLLAGQTWSTFMDANWVLYPSTVDFAGPAGATFVRQAQFRWNINDNLDFALENPENRVEEGTNTRGRDSLPDIILRYASAGDFSWQVAGLFQQFEVDSGAAAGESESNFGVTGGVSFKTGSGSFSIKANANSNRYTYYGFDSPSAVVVGSSIETIDHTAVVAAYNHDWGGPSNAKTTIAFGSVEFDDEFLGSLNVPTDGISETLETFHVNYRWSPASNVDLGVEVSNASRELFGGGDADNTRLQFGAQYSF